jgi:hypothetical protein
VQGCNLGIGALGVRLGGLWVFLPGQLTDQDIGAEVPIPDGCVQPCCLLLDCGLRVGELVTLRIERCDLSNRTLVVVKGEILSQFMTSW